MGKFRRYFRNGKVFLVVIRVFDEPQALRNAAIAFQNGANGIFLIAHQSSSPGPLRQIFFAVREKFPDRFIGLNFLCMSTPIEAVCYVPREADGLWVDDAGLAPGNSDIAVYAKAAWETLRKVHPRCLYFAGAAFKHQKIVFSAEEDAKILAPYCDVLMTSGEATGLPPSVEKLRAMRAAVGDHPIVSASGTSIENIGRLLPHLDGVAVATHISRSEYELDPFKVQALARQISRL